jgi:exopolysaccharide production protein ExoQ
MLEFAVTLAIVLSVLCLALRGRRAAGPVSSALWLPIVWVFIAGSRPLSAWLGIQAVGDSLAAQLDGSPFDRNVFAALIAGALIVLVHRRRQVGALLRANLSLVLFVLYCVLSIFWSDFPDVALKRWVRLVGDVAMVLVVLTEPSLSAGVETFISRLGWLMIPLSVGADLGRRAAGWDYAFGLNRNKNMYGAVLMVLGIGAVWRYLKLRGEERPVLVRRKLAQGLLVLMAIWCLWLANSMTSSICFVLGCIVLALGRSWLARHTVLLHVTVASLVLAALYGSVIDPAVGFLSAVSKDTTLTGRTDLWQTLLAMTVSPAFGAGFESFWLGPRLLKLWNMFQWHPNEAHNGYIELYLNLGWVGLTVFGLMMLAGYRRIVRGLSSGMERSDLRLAYFVVALIYSLTEAGFRIFSPPWIFLLLAIMGSRLPSSADVDAGSQVLDVTREPALGSPRR